MKKSYIAPSCKIRLVKKCNIIATSGGGGVRTGSTPGNEYEETDVSYGRGWGEWE